MVSRTTTNIYLSIIIEAECRCSIEGDISFTQNVNGSTRGAHVLLHKKHLPPGTGADESLAHGAIGSILLQLFINSKGSPMSCNKNKGPKIIVGIQYARPQVAYVIPPEKKIAKRQLMMLPQVPLFVPAWSCVFNMLNMNPFLLLSRSFQTSTSARRKLWIARKGAGFSSAFREPKFNVERRLNKWMHMYVCVSLSLTFSKSTQNRVVEHGARTIGTCSLLYYSWS